MGNIQKIINLKNVIRLLFLISIVFTIYSGYVSYPLLIEDQFDYVYNHISIFYWIGSSVSMLLAYLLLSYNENKFENMLYLSIIVILMYSIRFFYFSLPAPDAQLYRGLSEYVYETNNYDPKLNNHIWLQWPTFFMFSTIFSYVLNISVISTEFLLFAMFLVLEASILYIYYSEYSESLSAQS